MAKQDLSRSDLKRIVNSWKQQYGKLRISEKGTEYWIVASNSSESRIAFDSLFHILMQQYGFEAKDFEESFLFQIAKMCTHPDAKKKSQIEEHYVWDMEWVLAALFPNAPIEDSGKKYEGVPPALKDKAEREQKEELEKIKNVEYDNGEPYREPLDLSSLNLPQLDIEQDVDFFHKIMQRVEDE